METSRPQLFGLAAGLALGIGLLLASMVISSAWSRVSDSQVIAVTGSARRNVRSDLAIWRASFSADADSLLEAHKKLNNDLNKVETFLRANGIRDFVVFPVQIREITTRPDGSPDSVPVTIGYRLTRSLEVRSADVEMLPRLSGESTELLQQGVVFSSQAIEYIYTKAGEAKVEMMADATKDARARADQIAAQGGRKIKHLRAAKVGAVQINPLYSNSVIAEETNDISSLEKTITTTVSATFEMR